MNKETLKHLKVGDKIVRINTDYDYFKDDSTMEEEWWLIEKITEVITTKRDSENNESQTKSKIFTLVNWEGERHTLIDDKILPYSTTTLSAYENALERLKKQDVGIAKKIILCETMIADLKKENEDESEIGR